MSALTTAAGGHRAGTGQARERTVGVGLLGLGTVGAGVARILAERAAALRARAGAAIALRRALVRDLRRPRPVALPRGVLTTEAEQIVRAADVDVVVEVMGGLEPARTLVLRALGAGKQVVTANKALVATHGEELSRAAAEGGGGLRYEAAAAGAIPIVRALRESLAGDRIEEIAGILNGTSNHILTQMSRRGAPFDEALATAQELGYAEADPASDVGGQDSAFKLALLAELAFGGRVQIEDIGCEGIEAIGPRDVAMARELGMVIKPLAVGRRVGEAVELRVHPALLPRDHPLASVHDAFNAVFVRGQAAGELMFYGQGAGMMPTASAVISDLLDACRDLGGAAREPPPATLAPLPLRDGARSRGRYYVATEVADRPGVLAAIAGVFAAHGVSIETCIQKGREADPVDLLFVTHGVEDGWIRAALSEIRGLDAVRRVGSVIRLID